ncbi:TerB N-terminal domain-containing protein [Paratractidigestivibacter sp.]|uniref:TerB N-terminal domain-containing protein n=1 Tax=Paratractidigestivibacter sp. TaxID=2847316 RepID=UPI003A94BD81
MPDIDKILEQLLADPRLREGRAFASAKTYGDEPIIRRGSQMHGYVPDPIKQLRNLQVTPQGRTWSETRLFYEQARLLEDFEDHAPFSGQFVSYYPTYRSMNDRQLRGYFTWRADVRRGRIEDVSTSFAYVYIYELLMGIGVEPGRKAFEALEAFYRAYRAFDQASMDKNVRPWLVDYVVDHGLDPKLAAPYSDAAHDRAISLLAGIDRAAVLSAPPKGARRAPLGFGTLGDAAAKLVDAADTLATYRLKDSRLYKEAPEDFGLVLTAFFIRLARHYARTHNQGLVETLFGTRFRIRHLMYASAIHYEPAPHPDCVYELSDTRSYICKDGHWTCDGFHDGGARSAKLGDLCRAVDRQMRAAIGFPSQLKDHAEPKYLVKMIDAEISDYLAYKEAHKPVVVDIDLSKLAGIRAAASVTQEALLIDEERDETCASEAGAEGLSPCPADSDLAAAKTGARVAAAPVPGDLSPRAVPHEPEAPVAPPCEEDCLSMETNPQAQGQPPRKGVGPDLTTDERALIAALLGGGPAQAVGSVDLLVDGINEKLFGLVGDTVLEFGPDGVPQIIEDYADDVREALGLE